MATSANKYGPIFAAAAAKYGVPQNLLLAQAQVESGFNPVAVSPTGAVGLMQLEPANYRAYGVTDPTDPVQNVNAGAHLMADDLRAAGGDVSRALTYYHGGMNPKNWGPQTRAYVQNVQKIMQPSAQQPLTVASLRAMWGSPGAASAPQAQPMQGSQPVTVASLRAMARDGQGAAPTAEQLEPSAMGRFMVGMGRGFTDVGQTVKGALLHGAADVGFVPASVAKNYDAQIASEKQLYESTKPTLGMDVGQVAGQTAATLPAMLLTQGTIGAVAPRIAAALPEGSTAANAVRGVGNLLTGSAGEGMAGARGVAARTASASAQGAIMGAEGNALTGNSPTKGAEMGAIAGPAARIVGKGLNVGRQFVGNLVSPLTTDLSPAATERVAINKLLQAAAADGVTPEQIVAQMRVMGSQATPIDAVSALTAKMGGNVRQLGEEVAAAPGPAQGKAVSVLEGRADTAGARINDAVKAATEASGDVHGEAADLMAQRSAQAAPLYEKALSGELFPDERLQAFLKDPVFQSGLARGQEIARLDALAKNVPFNPEDFASLKSTPGHEIPSPIVDASGQPLAITLVPGQAPSVSMRAADAAKRGLDDMVEQYRDPTTGRLVLDQRGRALNDVRHSFVNYLDQASPDYAAARAAWAGPSSSLDALEMGRRALTNDAEITTSTVQRMSPSDRQFFLSGVTRALQDKIAGAQDGADVTRKIFGNSLIRSKIAAAFDNPKAFEQFERQMQAEAQYAATRNAVLKGSQTARRMLGAQSVDIGAPVNHLLRGDIGSATRSGLSTLSDWAMTPSARQLEARGNLLFEQNPETLQAALDRAKPGLGRRVLNNALLGTRAAAIPASVLGYEFNQRGR